MTAHILEDRRDTSDYEPLSRELLLRGIGGDLWIVTLDTYGSNRLRMVSHTTVHDLYPDESLLRDLAQEITRWFAARDEFCALRDAEQARRAATLTCPDTHGKLDYEESCPVCGWTNEIPF